MRTPPSREAWRIDGELHGHSPSETVAYLSDCADFEDERQGRYRYLPPGFVPGDPAEPRWLGRLRRLFGHY
jgi:hypothetical protein